MHRLLPLRLPILAAALILAGCGLDYLPTLVPPENGTAEQTTLTFYFTASESHDEIVFEGYELYYKLYRIDDETRLTENNLVTLAQLTSRGFLRVAGDTDTESSSDLPLVEVNDAALETAPFQVSIVFPVADEPYVTVPWNPNPLPIRRGVTYPIEEDVQEQYQRFGDISIDDIGLDPSDVRTQALYDDIERGDEVYLAMYALSYGRLFPDRFYSDAHYLSDIHIRLGL